MNADTLSPSLVALTNVVRYLDENPLNSVHSTSQYHVMMSQALKGEMPSGLELADQSVSADACRFRWLTDDHPERFERETARSILERMAIISTSSARASIDAAMIEFCPDRVNDAQWAEWNTHQRKVFQSRSDKV